MDSCFALIGAHQHGIAVGWMNGKNVRVSKTVYCCGEGKGWRVFNTRGFSRLCMTCELSPPRKKKRKKGRMDNPEGIACPTANGTSHLTFDRRRWVISCGSKSLFDMRFWMSMDVLLRKDWYAIKFHVTAFNWNQIYRNWQNIGYSRFISRLGESKMMSSIRTERGEKYSQLISVSMYSARKYTW